MVGRHSPRRPAETLLQAVEGLGEASPSVKAAPDGGNDLFYRSLPTSERAVWELSHM